LAWTFGKNTARGKNSKLQEIDLPIYSTDQSETLGVDGAPRGLPLARSLAPKTHSIKRNRKSTPKNTFPWKPPKASKSKPFQRVCWTKVTKQRGTKSSYMTSNKNPSKKRPKIFPTEALRVASTQALRSQRVSSASKLPTPCDPRPVRQVLQTGQAGFGLTATPGLRPRLCGSTE
jgi:hypothetical protein